MRARAGGNKGTPPEVKRRRGQKVRAPVAILPAVTVLDPPEADESDGTALVNAILEAGATAWVAHTDRLALLTLLRDAWDERAAIRADIAEHGYGGERFTRPSVLRLNKLEERITVWLSQLGLTPTDRARLGMVEVKAQSKLEELRERRSQVADGRRGG